MARIVIFGTGRASERAYQHLVKRGGNQLLAWCDNNREKVGASIHGVKVFGVEELSSLDFDTLWVASMYHQEIISTLIATQKINPERIKIVPTSVSKGTKYYLKDLEVLGTRLLKELHTLLTSRDIAYHIDHGTLLGFVRGDGFITWDNDIDIAVRAEDQNSIAEAVFSYFDSVLVKDLLNGKMAELSCSVTSLFGVVKPQHTPPLFCRRLIRLSLMHPIEESPLLQCDILMKYKVGSFRYWMVGESTLFSADLFSNESLMSREVNGCTINLPVSAEKYLAHMYGDWATPQEVWNHSMYKNLV